MGGDRRTDGWGRERNTTGRASWFKSQPVKIGPWPHIDSLTFHMFNSYLRQLRESREPPITCPLPLPSLLAWTWGNITIGMPIGMLRMEFQWMAADLTHHLVSAQGTYSMISNWTMVTVVQEIGRLDLPGPYDWHSYLWEWAGGQGIPFRAAWPLEMTSHCLAMVEPRKNSNVRVYLDNFSLIEYQKVTKRTRI